MSLFLSVASGGGGVLATQLTETITAENTTLPVVSTTGYLDYDYIHIGGEEIVYEGRTATSFTNCTRGYGGMDATPHATGSMVYTSATNALNAALGFNIGSVVTSAGLFSIVTIPYMFFSRSIPLMIQTAATLLSGSLWLSMFGIIWMILIAGFIITLAITIGGVVVGLVGRLTP